MALAGIGAVLLGGVIAGSEANSATAQQVSFARAANSAHVFVTSAHGNSVNEYAIQGGRSTTLVATIKGGRTGLSFPTGVAIGPTGRLFVANGGSGGSVTEYGKGATGNVAPVATIKGANAELGFPTGIAVGPSGTLFVSNTNLTNTALNSYSVTEYAKGASGNVAPIASIGGSDTGLESPVGLAVGPTGQLFVANTSSITEYADGASGNVAPVATIQGSNTRLHFAVAVALGPAGSLFVTNADFPEGKNSVTEYVDGASGNVAPVATIHGPKTGLSAPVGLAVGSAGRLFVANSGANRSSSVTEYGSGANGNVAPVATIHGPKTRANSGVFYGVAAT